MKFLLSTIFFSLLSASVFSRAVGDSLLRENISQELQVRQKPGTERLLTDYLRGLPAGCDTVYAILYEPTQCPRCEACIKADYAALKRVKPDAQMVLITAYPDSARAAHYNREQGYPADAYIYDADRAYLDILSFNSSCMIGAYIFKVCRGEGRVLFGAQSYYMGDDEFMRELVACKGIVAPHDYAERADADGIAPKEGYKPMCAPIDCAYADHEVDVGGQMLSDVDDIPKYEGNHFFYNDKLANCVMLFGDDGGKLRFRAKVEPDSTERDRFLEVDRQLWPYLARYYIPLAPEMMGGGRLGVSYSLPQIIPDTLTNSGGVLYFNEAAIVVRDVETLAPEPMFVPDFMVLEDTMFFYKHFKYCVFKGEAVYACQKLTWPMDYGREEIEHIIDRNSFCEGFYDTGNPFISTFSLKTGKLTGRYGELAPCARASLSGYAFVDPIMYSDGRELLFADGYSGTLYLTDDLRRGKMRQYSAFAVDTAAFPRPDTALFYKDEYAIAYRRFFYRRIVAARMDSAAVYCIVEYAPGGVYDPSPQNKGYTLVAIDRQSGLATEQRLPHIGGWRTLGFGLRTNAGRVTPFGFYRRADGGYVVREWTGG